MTFHALCHSTASMLFELGWHPKDIQEWLGHADFYTTMNIYTHIQKYHTKQKSEQLNGVLMPHTSTASKSVLEQPQKMTYQVIQITNLYLKENTGTLIL